MIRALLLPSLLVLVALLDYASGYEASLAFFYLIPVALAGWTIGPRVGVAFALAAAGAWMVADHAAGHIYQVPEHFYWNGINRLLVGIGSALFTAALRKHIDEQKRLIFELRRKTLTLSHLTGQIPVCPLCHTLRQDQAYRDDLAIFLSEQPDPRSLGRPCPDCLDARARLFASPPPQADPCRAGGES